MTENENPTDSPDIALDEKPGMLYLCLKYCYLGILKIFFRLQAHGVDNVPLRGGFLLIANHASNLDPPIVGVLMPRTMHTMAKEELFRYPVIRNVMKMMKAIPIRRGGADRDAIRQCTDWLKKGSVVSMFPEGTRTTDGRLQEGKAGAAMLAVNAGVPCLPVYIRGTFRAWPKGKKFPRPKKVDVYYGQPFDLPERPEGMKSRDYYQLCADEMMRRIGEIKAQVEPD